jgi:hypothetical protein
LKIRVPKRPRAAYVQDDLAAGTEEEQAAIRQEMGVENNEGESTFVIPVTKDGLVDLSIPHHGKFCRFCHEGPFDTKDARGEHEDYCAPVEKYPRFQCPCFMYSDDARMNVCRYWAVESRRAWAHARRDNRRRVTDTEYSAEKCPLNEKKWVPGMVLQDCGRR